MNYTKGRKLSKNEKSLKMDKMLKLQRLFQHKGWTVFENLERSLYSKFCKTLELLTDTQQEFLIDLTKDFLWITGDKYEKILIEVVKKVRASVGADRTIYFVPCKPSIDFQKVKSSDYVWYTLRDNVFRFDIDMGKLEMKNNFSEINQDEIIAGNAVVVLVDDFVGTGGTCRKTIGDLRSTLQKLQDNNSIKVMTLVTQQEGINQMKAAGVELFFGELAPKAIEESSVTDEEKLKRYYIMDEIEARIPNFDKTYSYGYQKSEALVSMIRCPNNTFPIYWFIPNVSPYERIQ